MAGQVEAVEVVEVVVDSPMGEFQVVEGVLDTLDNWMVMVVAVDTQAEVE